MENGENWRTILVFSQKGLGPKIGGTSVFCVVDSCVCVSLQDDRVVICSCTLLYTAGHSLPSGTEAKAAGELL